MKYLVLIAIVAAVWYGWRYVNRKPLAKTPAPAAPQTPPAAQPPQDQTRAGAEDLKPCPVCGTYTTGTTCGRPECRPA